MVTAGEAGSVERAPVSMLESMGWVLIARREKSGWAVVLEDRGTAPGWGRTLGRDALQRARGRGHGG
jgi:hypothetical protein